MLPVLLTLAIGLLQAFVPASSPPTVSFHFENPQLQPAAYSIEIHADGSGRYESAPAPMPGVDVSMTTAEDLAPGPIDRAITIGEPLRSQLFAAARDHHFFTVACAAPKMHVAFTGKKTLSYSGSDGQGSCTFNYSKDDQLNRLAEQLEAVSFTLEEGQKLAMQHEHSRLALDAEMETLAESARTGRALEIQNIAPQLKSIADDDQVLDRARRRARALLGGSGFDSR